MDMNIIYFVPGQEACTVLKNVSANENDAPFSYNRVVYCHGILYNKIGIKPCKAVTSKSKSTSRLVATKQLVSKLNCIVFLDIFKSYK